MNIKILVATHKPYWMPKDDVYLPIKLTREYNKELRLIGDDTGDNIAHKNINYCELSAQYWAWKNLVCDYIGCCHYRRYFAKHNIFTNNLEKKRAAILNRQDFEKLLQEYDVILPKKRNYFIETVRSQYEHAHNKHDLDEVEKIISEFYPNYSDAFNKVMGRTRLYILNMFVMKKDLLDKYFNWLFPILFELEKRIDITSYNQYEARVFGYIAERLFNVWIEKEHLKIKEMPIVFLEKRNWLKKITDFLERKFRCKK